MTCLVILWVAFLVWNFRSAMKKNDLTKKVANSGLQSPYILVENVKYFYFEMRS